MRISKTSVASEARELCCPEPSPQLLLSFWCPGYKRRAWTCLLKAIKVLPPFVFLNRFSETQLVFLLSVVVLAPVEY